MKPSLSSKILAGILKLINFKKLIESRAKGPVSRSQKAFLPKSIARRYACTVQWINKKAVATFENKKMVTNTHLIFLHGGAYIFEASIGHWNLAKKIVDNRFCRMTLLDYPLAPEHNYKETFEMVARSYAMLIEQYPQDDFIFMGDSAGGGLALAFTQKLIRDNHSKPPVKNILLSPWLDISLTNPAIKEMENNDHILTVEMLRYAGRQYAKGEDLHHYLLSPVNGLFERTPKTIVFYGTKELFYPDCIRLKKIVEAAKGDFIFQEYPGMQHDWAIFPIPESSMVIEEICAFLKE